MSPSNTFLQTILKTDKPLVNSDVDIEINSTVPLKYFNYLVIGRGDVITANTVQVPAGAKSHRFTFLSTYAMAPTAHVVVYYVNDAGEIIADALDVNFDSSLQNFVCRFNFLLLKSFRDLRNEHSQESLFFILDVYILQVKINATPDVVKPGKNIELSIEAKPNSYVGVLGIDQSVLLLKSGNDISKVSCTTKTVIWLVLHCVPNLICLHFTFFYL